MWDQKVCNPEKKGVFPDKKAGGGVTSERRKEEPLASDKMDAIWRQNVTRCLEFYRQLLPEMDFI